MWARVVVTSAAILLVATSLGAHADESSGNPWALRARTVELEECLNELEARENAPSARGALDQAERALQQAREPGADSASIARSQAIAEAALELAARQQARYTAQLALLDAERRLKAVEERAVAQRRALEALMRERAELANRLESP